MDSDLYEIVHEDDRWLVRSQDLWAVVNLGEAGIERLSAQDNSTRMAALLMHLDDGMSELEAAKKVRMSFPTFYLDPADREFDNMESPDDARLPFALKKRLGVFKLVKVKKKIDSTHTSFNACVRDLYRRNILK